jgi:hypothetical protein
MKASKFSEEQIAYALRQVESGTAVVDVCRQAGVSEGSSPSLGAGKHRDSFGRKVRLLAPVQHGRGLGEISE